MPNAAGAYSAPAATSTAAMPTSEWKAATSSGIEVIGTRRAITAPMPPPSPRPATTRIQAPAPAGGCEASVVRIAITMPAMPNMLPRRLDSGLDSPRSARMNRTPATRYNSAARSADIMNPYGPSAWPDSSRPDIGRSSLLFLLVHREHALRDQEAAEDVHRGEHEGDEAERARPDRAFVVADQRNADREQRA